MTLTEAKRCMKTFGRYEVDQVLKLYSEELLLIALRGNIVCVSACYEGRYSSDEEFVRHITNGVDGVKIGEDVVRAVMMDYCSSERHYFREE